MLASATLASVLLLSAIARALAQEPPPDPRMLLNLDLFAASGRDSGAEPSDRQPESLVDQIRTLRSLGFLGGQRKSGAGSDRNQPAPNPYSSPAPPSGDESEPVE